MLWRGWLREIKAQQMILIAQVEHPVREHRRGPARIRQLRHLPAADLLDFLSIRLEETEQTRFAECDQLSLGQNRRTAPKHVWFVTSSDASMDAVWPRFRTIPFHFSGREFHAAEMSIGFVATRKGEEMSVVQHRRGPMNLELRSAPDFLD